MADITQKIKEGLNFALNEASILGLDLDAAKQNVYVTFYPIALQSDGTIPKDNRFLFAFRKVGRIAASLKPDKDSKALEFDPYQLPNKLSEFNNEPIYGWEFIDTGEFQFNGWKEDTSFDLILVNDFDKQHTIDLFQEDRFSNKTIEFRIWFDSLEIFDCDLNQLDVQTFIDNGKRGWDKLYESGWTTNDLEIIEKLYLVE